MELTHSNRDSIPGSAEPLGTEERKQRLQDLAAWGVDLSLVQTSLERTPTERIIRMLELLAFARELHQGYKTAIQRKTQGGQL